MVLELAVAAQVPRILSFDGVSVDQFVMSAVTEKISALTAETYLRTHAARADPEAFRAILDKVPPRAPVVGDE
ncbi:toxin-antitoxin system HicB family antitoxin [Allochromatium palmeri]|uniref:Toxin-antitoxin system HicB family antitoxin n=1 Tax=Allochromatium palmeri TaxID=231048 RepID=A0A6N8ED30_9GAMM|nr:toxin-antitoxin system HicB family antitoxin [Allochromatium palmeri]MTW20417.1 toxin-antitoxin system HicB family antitoxin [Allochromatium palmeri]